MGSGKVVCGGPCIFTPTRATVQTSKTRRLVCFKTDKAQNVKEGFSFLLHGV